MTLELIITIMYLYHALVKAMSIHMIHINLNTIFYIHVEQSATNAIYLKYILHEAEKRRKLDEF